MSDTLQTIRDQLDWLTNSLRRLKNRVREAVAGELSRMISQSVEEVLQLLLKPQPRHIAPSPNSEEAWDDDQPLAKPQPTKTTSWSSWLLATGRILVQVAGQSPRSWWPFGLAIGASVAAMSPSPFWLSLWEVVLTTAQLLNS